MQAGLKYLMDDDDYYEDYLNAKVGRSLKTID
jgi:hypothetical protein